MHRWSRGFAGDSPFDSVDRVTTDASGNVIIAGSLFSFVDFGGGPVLNRDPGIEVILASLSANGDFLWSFRFGGSGNHIANDLGVDDNGFVLVAGNFTGTSSLGGVGMFSTADGMVDGFVVRLVP